MPTCLRVYSHKAFIFVEKCFILNFRYTLVLATPNRTKESCIKIIYIIYQNSSTTIFLIIATKVFVNLPITFNIKLPYLARGNGGVVYLPTVRLNLLYIECLQIHVSPSRKPVIFHGPCGNDTLAPKIALWQDLVYIWFHFLSARSENTNGSSKTKLDNAKSLIEKSMEMVFDVPSQTSILNHSTRYNMSVMIYRNPHELFSKLHCYR